MKTFKLILVALFCFSLLTGANAQNMLGENYFFIKEQLSLKKTASEKIETGYTKESPIIKYIMRSISDDRGNWLVSYYYFNNDNICYIYAICLPYSELTRTIKDMDEKKYKMGEFYWIEYWSNAKLKWGLEKQTDYFNLWCTFMDEE